MNTHGKRYAGGGVIMSMIILVLIAYGVFVLIQYVPIHIQSNTLDSVLSSIEESHRTEPLRSVVAVEKKIENLLNVNQMDDAKPLFSVRNYRGQLTIEVRYERNLNLLFQKHVLPFEKTLTLPR